MMMRRTKRGKDDDDKDNDCSGIMVVVTASAVMRIFTVKVRAITKVVFDALR